MTQSIHATVLEFLSFKVTRTESKFRVLGSRVNVEEVMEVDVGVTVEEVEAVGWG